MKASTAIREGREYMAEHGFDPEWHFHYDDSIGDTDTIRGCPQCFIGSVSAACGNAMPVLLLPMQYIRSVVGDISAKSLEGKWPLEDALAAMDIAADLAEADGN